MRKLILIFFTAVFISCSNDDDGFESKGVITGQDFTLCACCGGWFIEIEGEDYIIFELPENTSLKPEDIIPPFSVNLNWSRPGESCRDDLITVQDIEARRSP